jgi:polyisoprenoid-binding protein YceI
MSTDTSTNAVSPAIAQGTWSVDPSHSSVEFQVKHMGLATVKGFFDEFEGTIEVADDGTVNAYGTVEAASLNTRSNQRDEHLRSADFFDVENNAQLTFKSTAVEQVDEETYRITGDLTIRGTTREVVFEGVTQGVDQDPWGNTRVGLEVVGQIERSDFGLSWNQALESGGVLVGKKVKLLLDLSLVKA